MDGSDFGAQYLAEMLGGDLLGGMQQLAGPLVGAAAFTWLHDSVARATDYWRALLGGTMLLLVLLFPQGISGFAQYWQALIAPKKGVIA